LALCFILKRIEREEDQEREEGSKLIEFGSSFIEENEE
jgi:hypothetical protein